MEPDKNPNLTCEELARNLATFAIDRTDLKALLSAIPSDSTVNRTTIEYELQLLKILSVGWAISFFMPVTDKNKGPVSELFWECIREVSNNISSLTQTTTGKDIDYFNTIKDRLNTYLGVMQQTPDDSGNPAAVMGPAFADICNCSGDAVAVLTGTKMFTLTLGAVKEYLNAVQIDDIRLN